MSATPILLLAAEAATESSSGGLPQMDFSTYPSQIFWLLITFGVLYWLMSSAILPRLGGAIEERRDRIADDLDHAAEAKREAEEAERAYNTALADARAKAQSIAAETRESVEAEIAEMQVAADAKAAQQIEEAETRIAAMKDDATIKVREAASDVAKSIIATLIDETPSDDTISSAVNRIASE
ncbi:MAG: F0F1 ATP synthase subunit B' [Pseudomonadota bacterium]